MYTASIIRAVIALHSLINNKTTNRAAEKEGSKKVNNDVWDYVGRLNIVFYLEFKSPNYVKINNLSILNFQVEVEKEDKEEKEKDTKEKEDSNKKDVKS